MLFVVCRLLLFGDCSSLCVGVRSVCVLLWFLVGVVDCRCLPLTLFVIVGKCVLLFVGFVLLLVGVALLLVVGCCCVMMSLFVWCGSL